MKRSVYIRGMFSILGYMLVLYAVIACYAYFFADHHIFFPPSPSYRDSDKIIKIPSKNRQLISAIYLPNPQASYTILVSHGNAEDLGTMLPFLQTFHSQGYAIFAYDYQGYGTSGGRVTEKNTYNDEKAAYNYLISQLKISPQHIIAYGRSLGAAVAIDLAVHKKIAGLIVESAFSSAFRVPLSFRILFFDKYNNLAKISQISCPVLIIHGTKDSLIPFVQGELLYQTALPPKIFYPVAGAGHNNILSIAGAKYWSTIKTFTQILTLSRQK